MFSVSHPSFTVQLPDDFDKSFEEVERDRALETADDCLRCDCDAAENLVVAQAGPFGSLVVLQSKTFVSCAGRRRLELSFTAHLAFDDGRAAHGHGRTVDEATRDAIGKLPKVITVVA